MFRFAILCCIGAYFLSGCANADKKNTPAAAVAVSAVAKPAVNVVAEKKGHQVMACVSGKDERVVEITVPTVASSTAPNRVCNVMYTKDAKVETVASSNVSLVFCEEVLKKIKTHLETGGFSCKS